ncbi:MAG: hypothetical protein M0Z38_13175 [Deltaproteobacteria bacterium]|nr:hypothetical protein [Deltaproteobacteria bacterium]
MASCPHEQDAVKCIETRRERFRAARPDLRPWECNPCESCKIGRDRVEAGGVDPNEKDYLNEKHEVDSHTTRPEIRAWRELGRKEKVAERLHNGSKCNAFRTTATGSKREDKTPNENDYHNEKEEAQVTVKDGKRELILQVIQKAKCVTRGTLVGAVGLPKADVEPIAKALASEGFIKIWPGTRSDSVIYTIPDHPNPVAAKPVSSKAALPAAPRVVSEPAAATPPYKPRAKSEKLKSAEGRTSPAGEASAHGSLFEVDLRFVGILQERAGRLMGAIASESPIDGELLDLFCLTTDWLRERRATA